MSKLKNELVIMVPTYYGDMAHLETPLPEFGEPNVPVVVHSRDGVRVVLGTNDATSDETPAIQIERRPHGWAIFLIPSGDCDWKGLHFILDNGTCLIAPELQ